MRVYLATRFSRAEEMEKYRIYLQNIGVIVTSRWHSDPSHRIGGTVENPGPPNAEVNSRLAREDIEDLMSADTVVSFTESNKVGRGRGGRHVEFGIAFVLKKRLIIVGPRENVFHWLPEVETVETIDQAIELLREEA